MKESSPSDIQGEGQSFPNMPDVNLDQVMDYDVYDRNNENTGSITAIWTDRTGQPAFLGVRTTWLFGRTHVVPAYGADVSHNAQRIRLPYTLEQVRNAPNCDPDAELTEAHENEVMSYYQNQGLNAPPMSESQQNISQFSESQQASCLDRSKETPFSEGGREATPAGQPEEATMRLHEEEMRIGKREVEAGGIRLRKIVRTETVQQPVELKHEDIVVERVPAGEAASSGKAFEGEEIYIPLRREEAVIEKEARVREEVRVRKTSTTEQRTVSGEVRREDVDVEDERKAA